MDVSLPDRPLRRVLWGIVQGGVIGALLYLPAVHLEWTVPSQRNAVMFALVGAIICAGGQYLAHGILGGCMGLVAGALLGSTIAGDTARPTLAQHHINQPAKLSGITLTGKRYEITAHRGRVVLVDFWATWCPPCRAELPRLKRLYEQYHEDGLDIVGVSLDNERDVLVKFLKEQKIPWPQIHQEEPGAQGWTNPLLFQYTISAIPYTLLVDREGTIVASGLTGMSLEDAVERVMAGEKPAVQTPAAVSEPITLYFAVFGWLGGVLVERRLRQVSGGRKQEKREGPPSPGVATPMLLPPPLRFGEGAGGRGSSGAGGRGSSGGEPEAETKP